MRRILVPIDFADLSEIAVRYAAALARLNGSELTLLHVQAANRLATGVGGVNVENRPDSVGVPQIERWLEEVMPDSSGLTAQAFVLTGEPSQAIVQYARSERFDLIVMPTHGYGPLQRVFLGSVTARVLDEVGCPVFTGCHLSIPAGQEPRFTNVMCALDLGTRSADVLAWAADFSRLRGSRLFLVTAVPALGAVEGEYLSPSFDSDLASRATERLSQLRDAVGITAKTIVVGGSVVPAIKRQAVELRADLVVIGRGTDTGVMGRLRSNAYEIIRDSPCPVVSV